MAESLRRIKLLQAITYFVTRTTHCGKAKLYWLLFLLDFRIYAQTKLPVTGLDYYASIDGPVPLALDQELDSPAYDFVEQFHVDNLVLGHGRKLLSLHARGPFEAAVFTDLEHATLQLLATVHAGTQATEIRELSFLPAEPWRVTYEGAVREFEPIDYALAVPRPLPVPGFTTFRAARARRARLG